MVGWSLRIFQCRAEYFELERTSEVVCYNICSFPPKWTFDRTRLLSRGWLSVNGATFSPRKYRNLIKSRKIRPRTTNGNRPTIHSKLPTLSRMRETHANLMWNCRWVSFWFSFTIPLQGLDGILRQNTTPHVCDRGMERVIPGGISAAILSGLETYAIIGALSTWIGIWAVLDIWRANVGTEETSRAERTWDFVGSSRWMAITEEQSKRPNSRRPWIVQKHALEQWLTRCH